MQRAAVCVIGGGVIGASVALAAARRGVEVALFEAEPELALGASGTNSGILHTGFDSEPGQLETRMILRSAELRDGLLGALGVPVMRTGAVLRATDRRERAAVQELERRAQTNGVETRPLGDSLFVPGEAVTDPVTLTLALAQAAEAAGARISCDTRVDALHRERDGSLTLGLAGQPLARCDVAVNCAGLYADDLARAAGDERFSIRPRKGEFLVFDPPDRALLERIVLPVPSGGTKGVLVFPTVDGKLVAGPTAHDQDDKRDWSVRAGAEEEVMRKATRLVPALEGCEPSAAYAGLRPAGVGVNYLIERSRALPQLVHVAAIRSTGLSACLGIAEHVMGLLREVGVKLGAEQPLRSGPPRAAEMPWWQRSARHWASGYPQP